MSADMIRMKVPIITDLQVNILEYLKAGYKAGEIQIILDISQYEYYKKYKRDKNSIKRCLKMNERCLKKSKRLLRS